MKMDSNNIVIFSSCLEPWGGSEELWGKTAEILATKGFQIHVFKFTVDFNNQQIKKLQALGVKFSDLDQYVPSRTRRIWYRILPHHPFRTLTMFIKKKLGREINKLRPKLIIISQGGNFDGFENVSFCPLDRFPFVTISQRADYNYWANDLDREWMKIIWRNSAKNYFVSRHNLQLTQDQFGMEFENAEVVRNPFLTNVDDALPWEFSKDEKVRIACVGRLFVQDKGQDILLRVLADKKWRERNLEVSFFGKGRNKMGLLDFAQYLGLKNVAFNGHVSDVISIWQSHQALILPSRNEGLPLVLVEAMLCGRTAIVTDVGGNKEVLEDNVTGFISKSVDEVGVDEALERAWQRVDEWGPIGKLAAQKIREKVPVNPEEVFAEKLLEIIREKTNLVEEIDD
ncbi:MAG TPA: glycosyltransferase family 4 protein [Pyrinomonadaceae bacterium]|nr:glycosyltransferase family 4 protein [Pyrinomonadaceae bacterium]